MDAARSAEPLPPSPRHMRRRRFRGDVPASMLPGSGAESTRRPTRDLAAKPARPPASVVTEHPATPHGHRKASHRRKRLVVLGIVILVSLSIPVLALTLIFAG